MKRAIFFLAAIALATPAIAQHVHEDMQAQAGPPAGAPPQTPGGGAPGARGQGPQTPPIEGPWDDAIPPRPPEHAARALKETPRPGGGGGIKKGGRAPVETMGGY